MPILRLSLLMAVLLCCPPSVALADLGDIVTVAGNGRAGNNGDEGVATEIAIDQPFGVEVGPDGALYVTEVGQHRVRRVDLRTGRITTVAGSGKKGYAGDGELATQALLNEPYEVRFDLEGNLVFVEMQNHLVRRVDAKTRKISTIAGTGKAGFSGDGGAATQATFSQPHSIAYDKAGALYIADIGNHRIRRVDPKTGIVDTIAGTGEKQLPKSGTAAKGQSMFGPRALAVQGDLLWIGLREGNSIWKLDLMTGVLTHIAGSGKRGFSGDGGPLLEATFDGPKGIAVTQGQDVYVVDTENQVIRRIDTSNGEIFTLAGQGPAARGYGGDGENGRKAKMDRPHGVCVSSDGMMYIGDTNNHRVRRVIVWTKSTRRIGSGVFNPANPVVKPSKGQ